MPLLEITEETGFLDVLDFCERRGGLRTGRQVGCNIQISDPKIVEVVLKIRPDERSR